VHAARDNLFVDHPLTRANVVHAAIILLMPEPSKPVPAPPSAPTERTTCPDTDKVICERCGAEMFRMHAVWRCPACRYKTDCCGW
jgi:hypothetical protein